MNNKDLPAMPIEFSGFGQLAPEAHCGLTNREYFAAHAPEMPPHWLQTFECNEAEGDLFNNGNVEASESSRYARSLVAWRWHYADMMLEEHQ